LGIGIESTIVRCRDCHLVYSRPFLFPEGNPYAAYGADEYFHHESAAKTAAGRYFAEEACRLLGRRGRLLELGCGRGELLRAAAEQGWQVRGVDMTPAFCEADGLDIEAARVEEAESLNETYDVIYLAAILEHLYDPATCLGRVHRALAPDGIVLIDVPNECSLWTRIGNAYMRVRGRDWAVNLSPTFPPFHVVGFCPTSLRRLLARTGFTVLEMKVVDWPVDLPTEDGVGNGLEARAARWIGALGARLGMGMGILCWARKEGLPDHFTP
jgi:SAM-dependent methyltransferase